MTRWKCCFHTSFQNIHALCWHPCLFFVVIIKEFLRRKPGASSERDRIFPAPLRVWFSEFLWISEVEVADTPWEKVVLRTNSRDLALCQQRQVLLHRSDQQVYQPLYQECAILKQGCAALLSVVARAVAFCLPFLFFFFNRL